MRTLDLETDEHTHFEVQHWITQAKQKSCKPPVPGDFGSPAADHLQLFMGEHSTDSIAEPLASLGLVQRLLALTPIARTELVGLQRVEHS